ncbi:type IIA DNA topoisomerase subunit B [Methylobacillus gramineus]|uniref:DNA topoisomerase IV subunit B n=1 Tax=Methylobacillus gramineus TaxID=755169 RepID=UPI001CFF98A6|nr:DNA topoisomerase IV subunit B [Methylobacillus gramineus]MCB5185301.1 type IIA DNA topoisomerase subunit B [Methylobacillus gramineus]
MATNPSTYDASQFKVLEGLDPVRKRPGMYTRTDSPAHIIQEVLDNAADEALGGHATDIRLTIFKDGSAEVKDNGRGIPIDIVPGKRKPAVELAFTVLHAGGKFDSGAYEFSGGLHGVGVSVTNALSRHLHVQVRREGKVYEIGFTNGKVTKKLTEAGECPAGERGTIVRCWPDPQYFRSGAIPVAEMEHLVRSKALLLPGVLMTLAQETDDGFAEKTWSYPGGISEYLHEITADIDENPDEPAVRMASEFFQPDGQGASWGLLFNEGAGGRGESYVNLIPTMGGGTHVTGMKTGIFEAVRSFAEHHGLLARGVKISSDDIWGNTRFVLSTKIRNVEFQGQTKDSLSSRDAHKILLNSVQPQMETWLNTHTDEAKRIVSFAIRAANRRLRTEEKAEKKKSSGVVTLPGKLADCELAGSLEAELFIVEGDSAGGSAKDGRDRERQAILPIRGKIKNAWEVKLGDLFKNNETHDLFVAIGIQPHKIGDDVDFSGLRYGKIIILADADIDGAHIQTLLLTLFMRYAPELIKRGHVYVARPPLYSIHIPPTGKRAEQKIHIANDEEKESVLARLTREGVNMDKIKVQRFKGLGEMNPEQLAETTLNPDLRTIVQIRLTDDMHDRSTQMFTNLMDKSTTDWRKRWLEEKSFSVEYDD